MLYLWSHVQFMDFIIQIQLFVFIRAYVQHIFKTQLCHEIQYLIYFNKST